MAEITAAGIAPTDLTEYVEQLEAKFRAALGSDLNLATETVQGQLIAEFGLSFAQLDELAVHVLNGMNLFTAAGRQLDDAGTLFDVPRIAGERSTVTATLGGTSGTIVPAGSRARTSAGAVFASDAAATIGSGGTVDVLFRSVDLGPVAAAAGALDSIVDALSGWLTVTNASAAALGRNRETDGEYGRRYHGEVAVHARDSLEAIRARVLSVSGVTACIVRDNPTNAAVTTQGVSIAARSIMAIARGGADADVAAAIAATKPAGQPTVGGESVNVPHAQGPDIPISFQRVTAVPLAVTVSTSPGMGFPPDGLARIRANLLAWFAGTWDVPRSGSFDTSGLQIGESLDVNRLRTPINAVAGHTIQTLTVTRTGGAALGTPNLDQLFTLATGDVTLTVV